MTKQAMAELVAYLEAPGYMTRRAASGEAQQSRSVLGTSAGITKKDSHDSGGTRRLRGP